VHTRAADASALKAAGKLTGDKARLALDLVGSSDDVRAAMELVFGSTLVCDTMEAARACAFDAKVRMRAVTLDGDLFDPSGTLTGGSKSSKSNVLLMLHALAGQEAKVAALEAKLGARKVRLGRVRCARHGGGGLMFRLRRSAARSSSCGRRCKASCSGPSTPWQWPRRHWLTARRFVSASAGTSSWPRWRTTTRWRPAARRCARRPV